MTDLNRVTASFGRAHQRNTKAKKWLDGRRTSLLQAFTEEVAKHPLARRSVLIPEGANVDKWVKTYHPGWRAVDYLPEAERVNWILEEDPAYIKHTHVNPDTEMVFQRTIAEGSPSLDDTWLRDERSDLWERITTWPEPWWSMVRSLIADKYSLPLGDQVLDQETAAYLEEHGLGRVLRDLNSLSNEDLMAIEPYIIPGTRTIRVEAPRKATKEELEECA